MTREPWRLDRRVVIDEALRAGVISEGAAVVAWLLNDLAGRGGICRDASYTDLAVILGRCRSTIQRRIGELVRARVVLVVQSGRGWRRAAYALGQKARRGDVGRLRAAPKSSHEAVHPAYIHSDSPPTPSLRQPLLAAPASALFTRRDLFEPDRILATLEARGLPPPEVLDRDALRVHVHCVAANVRRLATRSPGGLLRHVLGRVPFHLLHRWVAEPDKHEAARTLADAERRAELAEQARAREVASRPAPPAFSPAERAALERANEQLLWARARMADDHAGRARPCADAAEP